MSEYLTVVLLLLVYWPLPACPSLDFVRPSSLLLLHQSEHLAHYPLYWLIFVNLPRALESVSYHTVDYQAKTILKKTAPFKKSIFIPNNFRRGHMSLVHHNGSI